MTTKADRWTCPRCHDTKSANQPMCHRCMTERPPSATYQWLTTAPNPQARRGDPFWNEYDQGQRGWRMHAVQADATERLSQIADRPAICGLRPSHGWSLDMFIDDKCVRCASALARLA